MNHNFFTDNNLSLVPVAKGSKRPIAKKWNDEDYEVSPDHLEKMKNGELNIGVRLGKKSNHLVDIDIDCIEGTRIAWDILPPTMGIFGRDSNPASHLLFYCEDVNYKKYHFNGKTILEIRSDGQQTLLPPSIHPSGEQYRFEDEQTDIGYVHYAFELENSCDYLAGITLIAKHWEEGNRHNKTLNLAGALACSGWDFEEAMCLIDNVLCAAEDEELEDRYKAVKTTYERYEAGKNVSGIPSLVEAFGDEALVATFCEWLGIGNSDYNPPTTEHDDTQPPSKNVTEFTYANIEKGSERHIASLFSDTYGYQWKYSKASNSWFQWDGTKWVKDADSSKVSRVMLSVIDSVKDSERGVSLDSHKTLTASISYAQKLCYIDVSKFDHIPFKLNTRSGLLDLRDRVLRQANPEDMVHRVANVSVEPEAQCLKWLEFISAMCAGDEELIKSLQQAIGLSMCGVIHPHKFFMMHGAGSNGKSVFVSNISDMLGDYADKLSADSLLKINANKAQSELVKVKGKRFISISELPMNGTLNTELLKDISGGDRIAIKPLYSNGETITPYCYLWIDTNAIPETYDLSDGFWRRLHIFPLSRTISSNEMEQWKPHFKSEYSGILNWALEGYQEVLANGDVLESKASKEFKEQLKRNANPLLEYLDDCVVCKQGSYISKSELFVNYQRYSSPSKAPIDNVGSLSKTMKKLGYKEGRKNQKRVWLDITFKSK